jgi:hypothetical protein
MVAPPPHNDRHGGPKTPQHWLRRWEWSEALMLAMRRYMAPRTPYFTYRIVLCCAPV